MPRPPSTEPKVRLNLEVTERVHARIDRVQALSEADSKTEAIRRAIAIYEEILLARGEGCRVILRAKDGEECEILVV